MNYYNEFDPFAAAWLRELIKQHIIPDGIVDERSIVDVRAEELKEYTQCHFFAGIGGWSYALQIAGWDASRPVWTGSCPCQPFSTAGKQKGKADERHLWPVWFKLIREIKPRTIFGEQVASAEIVGAQLEIAFSIAVQRGDYAEANRIANKLVKQSGFGFTSRWLDDVYQGMEAEGYAVGSAVLPACGVGAPHKRDRLWFVADTESARSGRASRTSCETTWRSQAGDGVQSWGTGNECLNVADTECEQTHEEQFRPKEDEGKRIADVRCGRGVDSSWSNGIWINCPDGKQRLIEPGIRLLANGIPNRVGKLRGYGNAIVPQVAAEFIKSYMEVKE